MELGPSYINSSIETVYNEYSWNSNASIFFIDQPVNTGFSYSSDNTSVFDSITASKDVYAFLTLFFDSFPEYQTNPFHMAGESYVGRYMPVFATEVLSHPPSERNFNFTSVLIGNGLTDPLTQFDYYEPMACGRGGYPSILDESECQSMRNALPRCKELIGNCYASQTPGACFPATVYCSNAEMSPVSERGKNPYDVRIDCESDVLCYKAIEYLQEWLNKDEVMEAVGAEVDQYVAQNRSVNQGFFETGDFMMPFHRLVPGILEEIPVLIYAVWHLTFILGLQLTIVGRRGFYLQLAR